MLRSQPQHQYVLMSGTIEVDHVRTVFYRLTGREMSVINSQAHVVQHFYNPYVPRDYAEWAAVPKPAIVFCDDKIRAQRLVDALRAMNFRAVLHHSSLNVLEKVKNEIQFGKGEMDFLVGTSGIAYGINTPTQSVVLYETGSATDLTITQILGRAGRPGYWARGFAFGARRSPAINAQNQPALRLGVRDRCLPKEEFFPRCDYWTEILKNIRQVERKSWAGRIDGKYLDYTENDVPIEIQETVFDLIEKNKPVYVPKLLKGKSVANDSTTLRWCEKLARMKTIGDFLGVDNAQIQFEAKWKVKAAMCFLSEHHRQANH
jgi:hypothetical protein